MKMGNKPVLEFRGLRKEYPRRDGPGTLTVLDDINKTIHEGEFVTLVGPSGCGKSTLLKAILGTLRITSGDVLLDGRPIQGPGPDRGVVYQKYSLLEHRTVLENVIYSGTMQRPLFAQWRGHGDAIKADVERAMEYLVRMGLSKSDANKYPKELSGGMKQRVAIVQTLFNRPRFLLMDEPFGALDPGTRADAQNLLLEMWEEERFTGIFITHALEEAVYMGSRLWALSQHWQPDKNALRYDSAGRVIANGSKVVLDYDMGEHIQRRRASDVTYEMYVSKFTPIMDEILELAMNPTMRQRVKDFHSGPPAGALWWKDDKRLVAMGGTP